MLPMSGSRITDKMKDIKGEGIQMLEDMEEEPKLKTVRRKDMDWARSAASFSGCLLSSSSLLH